MDIKLNRESEIISVNKLTIIVGENEFIINQYNTGEIIITKAYLSDGNLVIRPKVSNQIGIS